MAATTMHPATRRLFRSAAERFDRLRRECARARDAMWAGLLAANFSDDDIAMLASHGYMSPRDQALLREVRRPAKLRADEEAQP